MRLIFITMLLLTYVAHADDGKPSPYPGIKADGKIVQVLDDGIIIKLGTEMVWDDVIQTNVDGEIKPQLVKTGGWVSLGTVFVTCKTDGLIDDQHWSGTVWKVGTYKFTNSLGARSTIAKYSTSSTDIPSK